MKNTQGFRDHGLYKSYKKSTDNALIKNGLPTIIVSPLRGKVTKLPVCLFTKELFYKDIEQTKRMKAVFAAKILGELSSLKYMRVYADTKMYFLYNEDLGVYTSMIQHGTLTVIRGI